MGPLERTVLRVVLLVLAAISASLAAMVFFSPGYLSVPIAGAFALAAFALAATAIWLTPKDSRTTSVGVFMSLFFVLFCLTGTLWPVGGGKESAKKAACLSNLKHLSLGLLEYAYDHDDRLPPSPIWRDQLIASEAARLESPQRDDPWSGMAKYRCPKATTPWSYAMSQALSSFSLSTIKRPEVTVLLFEADAYGPNAAGGPEWFVPHHADMGNLTFADGHARPANRANAMTFHWRP